MELCLKESLDVLSFLEGIRLLGATIHEKALENVCVLVLLNLCEVVKLLRDSLK